MSQIETINSEIVILKKNSAYDTLSHWNSKVTREIQIDLGLQKKQSVNVKTSP